MNGYLTRRTVADPQMDYIEISEHPMGEEVFTPDACRFVTDLVRCFREERKRLLRARIDRRAEFAAGRLPENYYGQFIRVCEVGGMEAVCATEAYTERIEAFMANKERDPLDYCIDISWPS